MASEYPEHEKLKLVADKSQAIGEFIDTSGYTLAVANRHGRLEGVNTPINQILARYFEIDLVKLEQEKRAMLASLQDGG